MPRSAPSRRSSWPRVRRRAAWAGAADLLCAPPLPSPPRLRACAQAADSLLPPPPTPPAGGVPAGDAGAYPREALAADLAARFVPVDLGAPGLRVLHLDPPIFTVQGFLSAEECGALRELAAATGELAASKIGAGNVHSAAETSYNARRTSTGALLTPELLARHPALAARVSELRRRGAALMPVPGGWGPPARLPAAGQHCYEGLQARGPAPRAAVGEARRGLQGRLGRASPCAARALRSSLAAPRSLPPLSLSLPKRRRWRATRRASTSCRTRTPSPRRWRRARASTAPRRCCCT